MEGCNGAASNCPITCWCPCWAGFMKVPDCSILLLVRDNWAAAGRGGSKTFSNERTPTYSSRDHSNNFQMETVKVLF